MNEFFNIILIYLLYIKHKTRTIIDLNTNKNIYLRNNSENKE